VSEGDNTSQKNNNDINQNETIEPQEIDFDPFLVDDEIDLVDDEIDTDENLVAQDQDNVEGNFSNENEIDSNDFNLDSDILLDDGLQEIDSIDSNTNDPAIDNLPQEQNQDIDQDIESLIGGDTNTETTETTEIDDDFVSDLFSQDTGTENLLTDQEQEIQQDQDQEIEALFANNQLPDASGDLQFDSFTQDPEIENPLQDQFDAQNQEIESLLADSNSSENGNDFSNDFPNDFPLDPFAQNSEIDVTESTEATEAGKEPEDFAIDPIDENPIPPSEPAEETKKPEKPKRERGNGIVGRLLSAISGGKPIGVEGGICVIVFLVLLLLLIFMNLQATIWHPVGVSFLSTMVYVVLLNLFGLCGLGVPAWMFLSRGTKEDRREMKERNDVFKAMLGVGLIVMAVGAILLMFEFYRYDFTMKSDPFKPIQIPDGNTKLPDIKPNSNPEPLP
jgi:hypothetical protein